MKKYLFIVIILILLGPRLAFGAFLVNGDGTVTDTSTRLMWELATVGPMDTMAAWYYCHGLPLAGYNDWFVPNREQLVTLMDDMHTYSAIYWSSECLFPRLPDVCFFSDQYWAFDFANGVWDLYWGNNLHYVRACRYARFEDLEIAAKSDIIKNLLDKFSAFFVFNTLITCGTNVIPTNTPLEYPKKSISISSPKSLNTELL